MLWIIIAVVIFASGLFLLARCTEKEKETQEALPYQKVEALFSPAERSFLGVLQQAVGNSASIFGKVRVADVVEPKAGLGRSAWQKSFNKISAKHFDFLLCDKEGLSVAGAVISPRIIPQFFPRGANQIDFSQPCPKSASGLIASTSKVSAA